jgi:hypothetical protein
MVFESIAEGASIDRTQYELRDVMASIASETSTGAADTGWSPAKRVAGATSYG